jgi:hypothetical protein
MVSVWCCSLSQQPSVCGELVHVLNPILAKEMKGTCYVSKSSIPALFKDRRCLANRELLSQQDAHEMPQYIVPQECRPK